MFFILPVAVDYEARRYPVVTFVLMGINAALYLVGVAFLVAGKGEADPLVMNLGLVPAEKTLWSWLTSMFVHAGFLHIAGNMIYLFLFGACVEDILGRLRFSLLYLAGGLLANLSQVLLTTDLEADIPIVGASGAISACIGAFLIVLPRTKINFRYFGWFFFRVFSGEFWLPAWIVIAFWFLLDLVPLVLHLSSSGAGAGVALGAHVGGTVAGAMALLAMRRSLRPASSDTPHGKLPPRRVSPATAPPPEPSTVYVSIDGQQVGPYAPSQVRAMVALGSLPPEAYYWQEGMTAWRLVTDL